MFNVGDIVQLKVDCLVIKAEFDFSYLKSFYFQVISVDTWRNAVQIKVIGHAKFRVKGRTTYRTYGGGVFTYMIPDLKYEKNELHGVVYTFHESSIEIIPELT